MLSLVVPFHSRRTIVLTHDRGPPIHKRFSQNFGVFKGTPLAGSLEGIGTNISSVLRRADEIFFSFND